MWEAESGRWLAGRGTADGRAAPGHCCSTPDGKGLAIGTSRAAVTLWDVAPLADWYRVARVGVQVQLGEQPEVRPVGAA